MASGIYNGFKREVMKKTIDLVNDSIKVALMNNSHSFNPNVATPNGLQWSDVSANEASGTNYTAGGQALASKTVNHDDTLDLAVWDAADLSWTTVTITAYHAVIYDDTTTTKYLIGSIDFGGAKTATAGTFTITWSTSGIVNLT